MLAKFGGGLIITGVMLVAFARAEPTTAPSSTAQPPNDSRSSSARGKTVYDAHCVECHGVDGRGDGPAAHVLNPKPRDFTAARYKIRTTETGSLPTDDDLLRSIDQGLAGTSMPGWSPLLSDADRRDVVGYIKTFSPRFTSETPKLVTLKSDTQNTPQSVARGEQVYSKLRCAACHGTDGRGANAVQTQFEDDAKQPLPVADLTMPWTFRGGAAARDIFMRFRTGMAGTPMPSFADAASDAEMWDLANYVVSLARKPLWEMNADEVHAFYAQQESAAKSNPAKRGESLVDSMGCAICHTPANEHGQAMPGMKLAGGTRIRIEPFGDFVAGNLTSEKETGLGGWTDDEIKRVITKGIMRDGTRLLPYPMDWASFSTMRPEDLDAMVAYLRTVPPVFNRTPGPKWKFLPAYLWGKFRMLILGNDPPMIFFPGNAGTTRGRS
jgi:cbb3-type cytochrome c oxidase subunit III